MRRGLQQMALHQVADSGNVKLVELLLKHGAKINASGKQDMTALHLASRKKHVDVIRLLLEAQADVTLLDKLKNTPARYAQKNQSTDLAAALAVDGSLQLADRLATLDGIAAKASEKRREDEERMTLMKELHADW